MVDVNKLSEEDIKNRFITPAIENARWEKTQYRMEYPITDGKIIINGNKAVREKAKRADYVLFATSAKPIAVVEAKDSTKSKDEGIQQAMGYAQKLDAPFAYSSNGEGFIEHNFLTGEEKEISLNEFPTPEQLYERLKLAKNLNQRQEEVINQPFYTAEGSYSPRYYQRNSVNRVLDAIACGKQRLLLVLATGTGKTYIAFQTVYRLLELGWVKKVLYLADRNVLIGQSTEQDFAPLGKVLHTIKVAKDKKETLSAYQVYFALYQQLVGDSGEEDHYSELFDKDYFDLIIVDECHRGSASDDSQWRRILDYFSPAIHLGMTATPKESAEVSNITYFGEPIYTYSLKQGIEDGFLAPFKVLKFNLNIGDGWRPTKDQLDKYGNKIEDRVYNNSDYDRNIIIEDRTNTVAREISNYLKCTDRYAKTIVFTPTEDAAARMRRALINENTDIVKDHPDYIVRITGSDKEGNNKLKEFISVSENFPTIATTSKLLSTGVDTKMTKIIVLDSVIGSMTEFKQIIGRGTRLRVEDGKTHFVVLDFRNVTRLFADPDWDGPIEIDPNYPKDPTEIIDPPLVPPLLPPKPEKYVSVVDENGCKVEVLQKVVSVYDTNGNLLRTESIIDYTKRNILDNFASLENFISAWSAEKKKEKIRDLFREKGIDLQSLKEEQNMPDVDDFDFICHVAFDKKPLTRKERSENVKKQDFFSQYSGVAKEVLEALLDKYMNDGIYEIETTEILKLEPFTNYGKPAKIASYFGGKEGYYQAITDLENAIYAGGVA